MPPIFTEWDGEQVLDRKMIVRPRDSILATRRLASECGLFVGVSAGAAMAGALKVADRIEQNLDLLSGGITFTRPRAKQLIEQVMSRLTCGEGCGCGTVELGGVSAGPEVVQIGQVGGQRGTDPTPSPDLSPLSKGERGSSPTCYAFRLA